MIKVACFPSVVSMTSRYLRIDFSFVKDASWSKCPHFTIRVAPCPTEGDEKNHVVVLLDVVFTKSCTFFWMSSLASRQLFPDPTKPPTVRIEKVPLQHPVCWFRTTRLLALGSYCVYVSCPAFCTGARPGGLCSG